MKKIAILYQANPAPPQDGVVKPMKMGGYSDSGADLAFALKQKHAVLSPTITPQENIDLDWVFPDTFEGIKEALDQGANILWLNTVLYSRHPIKKFVNRGIELVGQDPDMVHKYDNKWTTNQLLSKFKIPIPKSHLILKEQLDLNQVTCSFPLVLKPIRGRGSQGVKVVQNLKELHLGLEEMFESNLFGTKVYAESYLSGDEITITVMPPGKYFLNNKKVSFETHWGLPPVLRFNHENGVAPYSGKVPVVENSRVLTSSEIKKENIQTIMMDCIKAASILQVKAPIRIDCRADSRSNFQLFDLNLKPNMTGNIRKGRIDQNSLSTIAATAIGWSYEDFIMNILRQKWLLHTDSAI